MQPRTSIYLEINQLQGNRLIINYNFQFIMTVPFFLSLVVLLSTGIVKTGNVYKN